MQVFVDVFQKTQAFHNLKFEPTEGAKLAGIRFDSIEQYYTSKVSGEVDSIGIKLFTEGERLSKNGLDLENFNLLNEPVEQKNKNIKKPTEQAETLYQELSPELIEQTKQALQEYNDRKKSISELETFNIEKDPELGKNFKEKNSLFNILEGSEYKTFEKDLDSLNLNRDGKTYTSEDFRATLVKENKGGMEEAKKELVGVVKNKLLELESSEINREVDNQINALKNFKKELEKGELNTFLKKVGEAEATYKEIVSQEPRLLDFITSDRLLESIIKDYILQDKKTDGGKKGIGQIAREILSNPDKAIEFVKDIKEQAQKQLDGEQGNDLFVDIPEVKPNTPPKVIADIVEDYTKAIEKNKGSQKNEKVKDKANNDETTTEQPNPDNTVKPKSEATDTAEVIIPRTQESEPIANKPNTTKTNNDKTKQPNQYKDVIAPAGREALKKINIDNIGDAISNLVKLNKFKAIGSSEIDNIKKSISKLDNRINLVLKNQFEKNATQIKNLSIDSLVSDFSNMNLFLESYPKLSKSNKATIQSIKDTYISVIKNKITNTDKSSLELKETSASLNTGDRNYSFDEAILKLLSIPDIYNSIKDATVRDYYTSLLESVVNGFESVYSTKRELDLVATRVNINVKNALLNNTEVKDNNDVQATDISNRLGGDENRNTDVIYEDLQNLTVASNQQVEQIKNNIQELAGIISENNTKYKKFFKENVYNQDTNFEYNIGKNQEKRDEQLSQNKTNEQEVSVDLMTGKPTMTQEQSEQQKTNERKEAQDNQDYSGLLSAGDTSDGTVLQIEKARQKAKIANTDNDAIDFSVMPFQKDPEITDTQSYDKGKTQADGIIGKETGIKVVGDTNGLFEKYEATGSFDSNTQTITISNKGDRTTVPHEILHGILDIFRRTGEKGQRFADKVIKSGVEYYERQNKLKSGEGIEHFKQNKKGYEGESDKTIREEMTAFMFQDIGNIQKADGTFGIGAKVSAYASKFLEFLKSMVGMRDEFRALKSKAVIGELKNLRSDNVSTGDTKFQKPNYKEFKPKDALGDIMDTMFSNADAKDSNLKGEKKQNYLEKTNKIQKATRILDRFAIKTVVSIDQRTGLPSINILGEYGSISFHLPNLKIDRTNNTASITTKYQNGELTTTYDFNPSFNRDSYDRNARQANPELSKIIARGKKAGATINEVNLDSLTRQMGTEPKSAINLTYSEDLSSQVKYQKSQVEPTLEENIKSVQSKFGELYDKDNRVDRLKRVEEILNNGKKVESMSGKGTYVGGGEFSPQDWKTLADYKAYKNTVDLGKLGIFEGLKSRDSSITDYLDSIKAKTIIDGEKVNSTLDFTIKVETAKILDSKIEGNDNVKTEIKQLEEKAILLSRKVKDKDYPDYIALAQGLEINTDGSLTFGNKSKSVNLDFKDNIAKEVAKFDRGGEYSDSKITGLSVYKDDIKETYTIDSLQEFIDAKGKKYLEYTLPKKIVDFYQSKLDKGEISSNVLEASKAFINYANKSGEVLLSLGYIDGMQNNFVPLTRDRYDASNTKLEENATVQSANAKIGGRDKYVMEFINKEGLFDYNTPDGLLVSMNNMNEGVIKSNIALKELKNTYAGDTEVPLAIEVKKLKELQKGTLEERTLAQQITDAYKNEAGDLVKFKSVNGEDYYTHTSVSKILEMATGITSSGYNDVEIKSGLKVIDDFLKKGINSTATGMAISEGGKNETKATYSGLNMPIVNSIQATLNHFLSTGSSRVVLGINGKNPLANLYSQRIANMIEVITPIPDQFTVGRINKTRNSGSSLFAKGDNTIAQGLNKVNAIGEIIADKIPIFNSTNYGKLLHKIAQTTETEMVVSVMKNRGINPETASQQQFLQVYKEVLQSGGGTTDNAYNLPQVVREGRAILSKIQPILSVASVITGAGYAPAAAQFFLSYLVKTINRTRSVISSANSLKKEWSTLDTQTRRDRLNLITTTFLVQAIDTLGIIAIATIAGQSGDDDTRKAGKGSVREGKNIIKLPFGGKISASFNIGGQSYNLSELSSGPFSILAGSLGAMNGIIDKNNQTNPKGTDLVSWLSEYIKGRTNKSVLGAISLIATVLDPNQKVASKGGTNPLESLIAGIAPDIIKILNPKSDSITQKQNRTYDVNNGLKATSEPVKQTMFQKIGEVALKGRMYDEEDLSANVAKTLQDSSKQKTRLEQQLAKGEIDQGSYNAQKAKLEKTAKDAGSSYDQLSSTGGGGGSRSSGGGNTGASNQTKNNIASYKLLNTTSQKVREGNAKTNDSLTKIDNANKVSQAKAFAKATKSKRTKGTKPSKTGTKSISVKTFKSSSVKPIKVSSFKSSSFKAPKIQAIKTSSYKASPVSKSSFGSFKTTPIKQLKFKKIVQGKQKLG